jgi:hypothetical protein
MTTQDNEFEDRVAAAVRARRAASIEDLGRDGTLWLAAAPLWTRGAAQAASFPVPSVIDFVRRARDIGWCETRGSLRGEGSPGLRFWMPDEVRPSVLDLLGQGGNRQRLAADARLIADRIGQQVPLRGARTRAETEVPDALRYWARLLSQSAPDLALVEEVAQAVDNEDLVAAQQLVTAGEALAPLLAGSMQLAADRARRLLSLGTRLRRDARALDRYLDRPELSGAVHALLRSDTSHWALHLRGVGGVGKTMLVRYLASGRYAAELGEPPLTIARVDFDHMSPDYPVRRPVQLLVELADELALYTAGEGRADQALARFTDRATSVHEALSSVREDHSAPMSNPAVLEAIDFFADTLRLMPRPLLILDTCEELDKADAGDPTAPAVSNTLTIIERINRRAPDVRVLLAGRRPLPDKDYLAVAQVKGFTTEEATRYLQAFASRRLPDELVRAMIRQSPAVDADPPDPGELPDRVSPFDLALYREWADEDPDLDVARVGRGSHAYIEGRIIDRLKDRGVFRSLPVLAVVGRCRVSTISAFLDADPAVLGPRLAEQEWIESDGDPPTHVSAAPALAARLRRYFAEPERSASFAAETERLAALLTQQVRDVPLDDVDLDELLAALHLCEPADAARLWDEVAGKAAAEGRWTWLFNTTRRVNGESAAEHWPTADALRATVLAATIAASRRAIPAFNPVKFWSEVGRTAGFHPDRETARSLRTRAALGALSYGPDNDEILLALEPGFASYDSAVLLTEVTAAAVDAAHRLFEAGAEPAAELLLYRVSQELPDLDLLTRDERPVAGSSVPGTAPPWSGYSTLRAWLLVAHARVFSDNNPDAAYRAFDAARADALGSLVSPGAPHPLFDVILPADLLARVRIERGLIDWRYDDGRVASEWKAESIETLDTGDASMLNTIDGDRLISLCLQRRLADEVPSLGLIESWENADRYTPRVATSSAHDLVPPLFVSIAEAWLAAGDPQRALDHVERHRRAALKNRDDEATLRHADAETMRIARRLRLTDQLAVLTRLAYPRQASSGEPGPARLALADDAQRALAVVRAAPSSYAYTDADVTGRPAGWHAWWQCQSLPVGQVPEVLWGADDTDTALAEDIEVDCAEFERISLPRHQQLRATPALASWLALPRSAPRARSAQPHRHLRAELRHAGLQEGVVGWPLAVDIDISSDPYRGVPRRVLAEMAFDEAELLALRFPDSAAILFRVAAAAFREAGDRTGWMLAELALVTTVLTAKRPDRETAEALRRFHGAAIEISPDAGNPFRRDDGVIAEPWRYWAQQWSEVPPSPPPPAGLPRPTVSPWSRPRAYRNSRWFRLRSRLEDTGEFLVRLVDLANPLKLPARLRANRSSLIVIGQITLAGTILGLAEAAAAAVWVAIAGLPGFTPLIAVGVAVAASLIASTYASRWRRGDLKRLADACAVGTSFRPASLELRSMIRPGRQPGDYSVTLWAQPPSLWQVPLRRWPRLLATTLAMSLASAFRRKSRRRNGYNGSFTTVGAAAAEVAAASEGAIRWNGDGPEADADWWSGPTTGLIVTLPADAPQPWERILSSSLGPHAAGQIEWRRQMFVDAVPSGVYPRRAFSGERPYGVHDGTGVLLDASSNWVPLFADAYPATEGQLVQVRHAIGAAVSTSAGTRLQVTAGPSANAGQLLGPEELRVGDPSLIIIQAEPVAAYSRSESPADLRGGASPDSSATQEEGRQIADRILQSASEFIDRQAALELEAQLALAIDLILSTAASAVMLLPALPADTYLQLQLGRAIARYASNTGSYVASRPPDPRWLQAELRSLLRPTVRRRTLDDIVLFQNIKE